MKKLSTLNLLKLTLPLMAATELFAATSNNYTDTRLIIKFKPTITQQKLIDSARNKRERLLDKEKVYQHYVSALNEKINGLQQTLNELSDSAKNETKSTAGDKHETALAMLQIEQENTRIKFREATEQKAQLESINIELSSLQIIKGSLIKTNKAYFFLCVALGKCTIDNIQVIAISPQSPLGAKLIGLKEKDTVQINDILYTVENIL